MPPTAGPNPAATRRNAGMCGRSKPASSPPDTAGQRVADRAVRIAEAGRGWFLRAHCVVTGLGWAALSVLTAAGLALGHSLVGELEQVVFLGILVLALGFEAAWRAWTGTNALGRASTADCDPDQEPTGRSR